MKFARTTAPVARIPSARSKPSRSLKVRFASAHLSRFKSTRAGSGAIGMSSPKFYVSGLRLTKHRGCLTPQVIGNVNALIDGEYGMLDGYDELPADVQEKVRRALEQGHVDDEDWKGVSVPKMKEDASPTRENTPDTRQDVEKNRPGEKGFRNKTPKKKAADEDDEVSDVLDAKLECHADTVRLLKAPLPRSERPRKPRMTTKTRSCLPRSSVASQRRQLELMRMKSSRHQRSARRM